MVKYILLKFFDPDCVCANHQDKMKKNWIEEGLKHLRTKIPEDIP